ncbi:MAG TPA: hypothetical protein VMG36_08435 [Thermoplasmata archaeon]|nr:hypothetical protein [Thermoplasmata archaeon]
MDDASLAALNEAIRDQDAQWEAEQKNPQLRKERLRREYVDDQLRWGVWLAVAWAAGLLLGSSDAWAPQLVSRLGGAGVFFVLQFLIGGLLFFLTIGVAVALVRRRTEYRTMLASPPPSSGAPAVRPRPTLPNPPPDLRRGPPPPDL